MSSSVTGSPTASSRLAPPIRALDAAALCPPTSGKAMVAASSVGWEALSRSLEGRTAWEILEWAAARFGDRLTMATAFGPEGCVLMHMLATVAPRTRVFNLDTGYQFAETLELRERIRDRYGIEVEWVRPETSVADYEAGHARPLYETEPDRCCRDRKIIPLKRAIQGYDAWITAIRAEQSPDRARANLVGPDPKFDLIKINPLLHWTRRDVWAFVVSNRVPYNPLHDRGYASIGCWPCTRPAHDPNDERSGRWAGQAKTECGLHSLDSSRL